MATDQTSILSDRTSLYKLILFLYYRQTSDEQSQRSTHDTNGVGFNMLDAEILSSFAEQILAGRTLSDKQVNSAQLRLPKYHRQWEGQGWQSTVLPEPKQQPSRYADLQVVTRTQPKDQTTAGSLRLDGDGIAFYPNVYPSKQIKDIGFTRWEGGAWHQSRPHIRQQVVDDVLRLFGSTVVVDPKLQERLAEDSKPVELPEAIQNHDTLFPFQKESIQFAIQNKRVLLGLAPGLGKTACAIFAAQAAGCQNILVVSPLGLIYNWRNEIAKWVGDKAVIWYGKMLPVPGRWVITNYDTLRLRPGKFTDEKWDAIIVDESISIKNRHTARFTAVKTLVATAKPKYVWLLSGAPISRLYNDMWSQLNVLDPSRFSSYWRFVDRYCVVQPNQWSKYNIVANRPDAATNAKHDLADVYFARTQDQVLNLPDWIMDTVEVEMTPEQDKMYASMEEQFLADLPDGEKLLASNILAQLTRLVQIASNPVLIGGKDGSAKWAATIEMLEYETSPFIIWTSFIDTANSLVQQLQAKGFKVAKLTGAVKEKERQEVVDKFQAGELDVIVAHPAVGKFGFTLTAARTAIYLERTYNGDDYYQSLHRIRRIGTTASPHVIHLLSTRHSDKGGTVDSVIDKILKSRRDAVLALTEGSSPELTQTKITGRELKDLFTQERK